MLEINDLKAGIDNRTILNGFTLTLQAGEFAALMGPNGSGKSTLAHVLAGHPSYEVTGGTLSLDEINILDLAPEARSQAGIFLAFQYPASIPGVSVSQFLRLALNAHEKAQDLPITGVAPFIRKLREAMKQLHIPTSFAERAVNDGFSGGEKKRLEMLQMLILQPKLVILDEIDSGLDIDAMKVVATAVNSLDRKKTSVLIITHYQRLLDYLVPDSVHIMKEGKIIKSGKADLAKELEKEGYESL